MQPKQAEYLLAIFYGNSMILSVTSIISLVTAWQHWSWTLDSCFNVNCGCILYGTNTFNTFIGGDVKLCYFTAYALIPIAVIGLCLGSYHGYRCCIDKNLDKPKRLNGVMTRDDDRYLSTTRNIFLLFLCMPNFTYIYKISIYILIIYNLSIIMYIIMRTVSIIYNHKL